MIISPTRNFIFVAIPKTGTHSVREALREHMGPDDLEQVRLFGEKKFPFPEISDLRTGHISLTQIRPVIGEEEFRSRFKFAFVRNPFDRFVSFCSFMTRNQGHFERDHKGVMRHFALIAPPLRHLLFRPQHTFLTGEDGAILADYVGRNERMQQSYDEICERIGITSRPLAKTNSSRRGDYRDYYDQQLVDGVAKLYARDLELFGYEF
ncbi:MAG TPA: sulfotransferase family 2 domain-containing protein [Sphingomicrobium sp.]|nr:sulfotransferase family 2 domain-containing protein [Sphingomicrobium sp.]